MKPNRIREIRLSEGITQETLGSLLKVSKAQISNYELGKRRVPVDFLIKFASFFNVSTDYVLGLEDHEFASAWTWHELLGEIKLDTSIKMMNEKMTIEMDRANNLEVGFLTLRSEIIMEIMKLELAEGDNETVIKFCNYLLEKIEGWLGWRNRDELWSQYLDNA